MKIQGNEERIRKKQPFGGAMELTDDPLVYNGRFVLRGLNALPVKVR